MNRILVSPKRFFKFCIIGLVGAILQYAFYHLFLIILPKTNLYERFSFAIAIVLATGWNFIGNSLWTFKDRK